MALPPLQNLLDLLPDNTEGLIEPVDLRSIVTDLYSGVTDNINLFQGFVRTNGTVTMDDGYEPSSTLSVATKGYVDSVLFPENFVQKTGDTMSGDLYLPLYDPIEFGQAAHKGYVDKAIQANGKNIVTTDSTAYSLITKTPQGVKIRGLKPSQNVTLTDDGVDIVIKANVAGTGGDVRTDVSNVYDANTVQTFDKAVVEGIDVGYRLNEHEDSIADLETDLSQTQTDLSQTQVNVFIAKSTADAAQDTINIANASKAASNTTTLSFTAIETGVYEAFLFSTGGSGSASPSELLLSVSADTGSLNGYFTGFTSLGTSGSATMRQKRLQGTSKELISVSITGSPNVGLNYQGTAFIEMDAGQRITFEHGKTGAASIISSWSTIRRADG